MLTELHCKRAKPTDKNQKLADGRGLYLFVTPTGFKSWRWKYRIGGKEKRLVFGAYPEMPLAEARDARDKVAPCSGTASTRGSTVSGCRRHKALSVNARSRWSPANGTRFRLVPGRLSML